MNNTLHKKSKKGIRGVALVIAILTSGIILSIGSSVLNVAIKQLQLSAFSNNSSIAFYAANSGLDCALLWDIKPPLPFTESIFATSTSSSTPTDPVFCAVNNIVTGGAGAGAWTVVEEGNTMVTTFQMRFSTDINAPCSTVVVKKWENAEGRINTSIDVRGLNSCNTETLHRTERGIRVLY